MTIRLLSPISVAGVAKSIGDIITGDPAWEADQVNANNAVYTHRDLVQGEGLVEAQFLVKDGQVTGLMGPDGLISTAVTAVSPSGDTTGITDAAAINAAIVAVAAEGGGTVELANGIYYVKSDPILFGSVSNVTLRGNDKGAKIKLADNQEAAVPGDMPNIIEMTSATRCRVTGIALDGNYANQNMANLAMSFGDAAQGGSGDRRDPFTIRYVGAGSAASLTISGNVLTTSVTGAAGDNLNIDLTAAGYDTIAELVAYIDGLAAYTCTATHSTFGAQKSSRLYATTIADIKTAAVGVNFTNASNAGTHEIYGNNIYMINCVECSVDHNDLSNAPHMGVLITGNSSRNTVAFNTGELNNWRACEIWPNAGTASVENIVIGNTFNNSYHDSIISEFAGTERNIIANNVVLLDDLAFNDGQHEGLQIYASEGNIVSGNSLRGCHIVVHTAGANYNIITGNTVDGMDGTGPAYRTRGVYIKAGIGNVVTGNTCDRPYYDTIRVDASASKTVVKDNILTGNDNASRYPIYIAASSADNIISGNILDGNTNGLSDSGTRTIVDGLGTNGSNDPASAGNWLNNGRKGVVVLWDSASKKRLSMFDGTAWVNFYTEP